MNNLLKALEPRKKKAVYAANTNYAVLAAISGPTKDRNNTRTLSL